MVRSLPAATVEQEYTASEKTPLHDGKLAWVTADRHSQWPGVSLQLCLALFFLGLGTTKLTIHL